MNKQHQHGFSLVELAMVLLIIGLVLGTLVGPLGEQRQRVKREQAYTQMQEIQRIMLSFVAIEGRLPCPASDSSLGTETFISANNRCTIQHGFVPAVTLGMAGSMNRDNLLMDPWQNPYRYSVTNVDTLGGSGWDFITFADLQSHWPTIPAGNYLRVCDEAACGGHVLSSDAPAVLVSMGADWATAISPDQLENVGGNLGVYSVADDSEFVSRVPSLISGAEFDDLVLWLSPHQFYAQLLTAGRLP